MGTGCVGNRMCWVQCWDRVCGGMVCVGGVVGCGCSVQCFCMVLCLCRSVCV